MLEGAAAERDRIMELASKILECECSTDWVNDAGQCMVCEFTDAVYGTGDLQD